MFKAIESMSNNSIKWMKKVSATANDETSLGKSFPLLFWNLYIQMKTKLYISYLVLGSRNCSVILLPVDALTVISAKKQVVPTAQPTGDVSSRWRAVSVSLYSTIARHTFFALILFKLKNVNPSFLLERNLTTLWSYKKQKSPRKCRRLCIKSFDD